ncbi:anti-sigma B factor antagonist [Anaerosolibacter carboniphilus]|uniref:Anti-sigma factor antagonist n=1 Tax=Anaerosolibacter carboniphilus TaxID=1417629 RepID=A0A841KXG5_9FIRM|nr:anti-sigma B factor antagonist [Anaerosolibacter carboniphilus]
MSLNINTILNQEDDLWIVDVIGEIDIYTANKLKETLVQILNEHNTSIKINCLELDYIDSTGLGVLIGALKRLKQENKNIIISNAKSNISKLLTITGLNKIFVIE